MTSNEESLWRRLHRNYEFRHSTLLTKPGRFRLFYLRPGKWSDDIQIEYFKGWLGPGEEPYKALSYTWGDPEPSKRIEVDVDGTLMWTTVTPNLEAALRQLRDERTIKTLWVDALCINQDEGNKEKPLQIQRMSEIYSNAQEVLVWLGETSEDSPLAMEFINEVSDLSRLDYIVKDPTYSPKWKALGTLMRRSWFSRRWVVQELALATQASVHCGPDFVRWPEFADAVAIFEAKSPEIENLFNDAAYSFGEIQGLGAHSLVSASQNLYAHSGDSTYNQGVVTLEYLISNLSVFQVSNPWDTVYALLSLAKDARGEPKLAVNYTKPLVSVLKDVVDHIIKTSGSVDIICRPWAPTREQIAIHIRRDSRDNRGRPALKYSLPSWMRDTAETEFGPRSSKIGVQYDRVNANRFVGNPGEPIYSVSGSTRATILAEDFRQELDTRGEVDTRILAGIAEIIILKGFKLDGIAKGSIGGYAQTGNVPPDWLVLGSWTRYRDSEAPEPFWRTIVADRGLNGARPPLWYRRACEHAWSESASPGLDTKTVLQNCGSSMTTEFISRVRQTILNRQMFLTRSNKLCLGPSNSRNSNTVVEDDIIYILVGCSVPVILRQHPTSDCYTFVGECYVHGIMNGEAMTTFQKSNQKFGDIWIR